MWIGTQKIDGVLKYSKFNGKFWAGYKDYTPIMTHGLHRWNDGV